MHSTQKKPVHSNRDTDVLNLELLLLLARHFHEEADKNAHEYKYIFPKLTKHYKSSVADVKAALIALAFL